MLSILMSFVSKETSSKLPTVTGSEIIGWTCETVCVGSLKYFEYNEVGNAPGAVKADSPRRNDCPPTAVAPKARIQPDNSILDIRERDIIGVPNRAPIGPMSPLISARAIDIYWLCHVQR